MKLTQQEKNSLNQLIESSEYNNFIIACTISLSYVQHYMWDRWAETREMTLSAIKQIYLKGDQTVETVLNRLKLTNEQYQRLPYYRSNKRVENKLSRKDYGASLLYSYTKEFKFRCGILDIHIDYEWDHDIKANLFKKAYWEDFNGDGIGWEYDIDDWTIEERKACSPRHMIFHLIWDFYNRQEEYTPKENSK